MSHKLAIIEDDPVIAQMYRMKFEAENYRVEVASNGKLGVDLVKEMQPDIVLLDLKMPIMNGEEALKEIRKNHNTKHTPVIILTNLGEEEVGKGLRSLGIHSFIVKADFTPSQVTKHVKEALAEV